MKFEIQDIFDIMTGAIDYFWMEQWVVYIFTYPYAMSIILG